MTSCVAVAWAPGEKAWSSGEERGLKQQRGSISMWMVTKDKEMGEVVQGE